MARYGDLDSQYFDDSGNPVVNGKIYFYETGTTTLKNTYADVDYTIANTNPVVLTAAGRQPNIFFAGVAKAILTTNGGTQILVRDPVGVTTSAFGDPWVSSKTYGANEVVQGSNGQFYTSLVSSNLNNNPVTSTGSWTFLYSVEWSAGTTYTVGSVVTYLTIVYQSILSSNTNQNPSTATTYWTPIQLVWMATQTYALNANIVGTNGVLYTSLQAANINHEPSANPAWWVGTSAAAAASATAAAASATAASTSATNAATSATTATTQATNAATSATSATSSATAASTSATNAATSATTATTQASNASTSATAAASSATSAGTSATNSANSATAASGSATTASTQATNAASSATTASTQASNAATSATSASGSATTATTQAGIATTQASNASTSASNASTSATNAATSATNSAASATSSLSYLNTFKGQYYGALATDPTLDPLGAAMTAGDLYWNTTSSEMRVYSGSVWAAAYLPTSGYATSGANSNITSLSGLTTPLSVAQGGTGVANNAAMTVTGSGNFAYTRTLTGTTNVTLPTTGTLATLAGSETFTNKTLTSPTLTTSTITGYTETVTAGGTVTTTKTIVISTGTVYTATLTASTACVFTMPTATAGTSFIMLLKQAATTGNGTATFTSVKWGTAGAPTITATAGKLDILTFVADGTNWYGSIAQGYTY